MRRRTITRGAVAAVLCLGGLSGCSDDTTSGEQASPETVIASEPSPVTTAPVTAAPAGTSPAATTAAMSTVPAAGVVTDEIDVLPSVDWLEVDEHGVWAKPDPAFVYLIDPETNEVRSKIQVGGEPCQGLGAGDGSVWACAGPDVVRIDPASNEVVATLPVGKAYAQGELAVSSGLAWILTGDGSSLIPIDTATDTPGVPITLPARGTDLGAGRSGIWIVSSIDDVVMHVDPATGVVLSTTEVPGPTDVAVDDRDDAVWVVTADETVKLNPTTGSIDLTVPVGGGSEGSIAVTEDTVWLRTTETFVTRIDRASGAVIDDEKTPVYADIADRLTSGGDIVIGFGSVWTSAYDDAKLFRLSIGEPGGTP